MMHGNKYLVPISKKEDLPRGVKIQLYKKYGVYLAEVIKGEIGERVVGVFGNPKTGFSHASWEYFEYACDSFKEFEKNIQKQQATLYLCLYKHTWIPKDVIKIIIRKLWIYRGPFYRDGHPWERHATFISYVLFSFGVVMLLHTMYRIIFPTEQ